MLQTIDDATQPAPVVAGILRTALSRGARLLLFAGVIVSSMSSAIAAQAIAATVHHPAKEEAREKAIRENNAGVAMLTQQLPDRALIRFRAARTLAPEDPAPLLNEGITLLYQQKDAEAEELLLKVQKSVPTDARAAYCLGLLYFRMARPDAALEAFQRALELDPRDADGWYFLGSTAAILKKDDVAQRAFERAIELNPAHASAEFGLARMLQHRGSADKARLHFTRFQQLSKDGRGRTVNSIYGEQGRNAMAQELRSSLPSVEPLGNVAFTVLPLDAGDTDLRPDSPDPALQHGAGLCVLDLFGDHRKTILSMGNGNQPLHAWQIHDGHLVEKTLKDTGLDASGAGKAIACAVGDFNDDGTPDLAIAFTNRIVLLLNQGPGRFKDVTQGSGVTGLNQPSGLSFVDFDHDGDLDLLLTGSGQEGNNILWRNNGDGTFTQWTKETGLSGSSSTSAAILSDINSDRAVDLITTGMAPSPELYFNQREGAFRAQPLYRDALGPTRGIVTADFEKTGRMDIAVTHVGAPGLSVWSNTGSEDPSKALFERIPVPLKGATGAFGLAAFDVDNDGFVDLAVLVDVSGTRQLRVLRNCGPRCFEDDSEHLGLKGIDLSEAESVIAVDTEQRGVADLIIGRVGRTPLVLHNSGDSRHHALRLALQGLADNRSAIGTQVELIANGQPQHFEITGSAGLASQGDLELLAGLGTAETADVVRLLWPTGVPQDEIDKPSAKPSVITELDRRGSSCPTLFTWNGERYEFISDVIGAGVVGHWISPTEKNIADPDEWVRVRGDQLKAHDGLLSLRFGEPMEEVNYIDQVKLVAIDHPAGTEAYPEEAFLDEPPFASGKLVVASSHAHVPEGAWDDHGNDVRQLLSDEDHRYVRDFDVLRYAGFTNEHQLTLDLGDWKQAQPLRLFLTGYIEYFTANSMYAAWQAGLTPQSPSLEAQLPDGSWKTIIKDLGFPAGLQRTIVADLTGRLPVGTRRVRLRTNLQIYWDKILVDNAEDPRKARTTELPLHGGNLAFRGYPKQIERDNPGDLTYDYNQISATGPFFWQRGNYTRYGDVTPLLEAADNRYVVFGSGEEIEVQFDNSSLPPLSPGWRRDYLFYVNGYVKDMDFYEASPYTVSQMPFHGMSAYPYGNQQSYPLTRENLRYELEWNDRSRSGEQAQPHHFDYKPTQERLGL
ncbi:tetratricopeptide (TPR) repeat protein [Granulicella aggregans]|uniref:Tetratricopeptide (TPR) repeat protein n=1 Tax=Granulicella aggregans TaxID=474949 RepID=A0A7W8E2C4_9BACT|nr:FG-GAP-like repeat-containing protein [Granulicella aggregans]MBB5056748.1 tetratricopeptide (TPR) repeat protein [Granulicella aggregans]